MNHKFWGDRGRHKNVRITAEAVGILLKAQTGSENKILKGLVKRHAAECYYGNHTHVNLRQDIEIKMQLKCAKRNRAAFNKQ